MRVLFWAALSVLGIASSGCRTLDRFDTEDGEAYCGSVVTSEFIKNGLPAGLRLRVRVDTDNLSSVPGTVTSNDTGAVPSDPESTTVNGPCTPQPFFSEAPMVVAEQLNHDQLSTFDFGSGRDYNSLAWAESTCRGQVLVVLSLMKNDDVEVRLMKPPDPAVSPADAWFGLFQLTRQKDNCLE